jgi:hypothetical protein
MCLMVFTIIPQITRCESIHTKRKQQVINSF